MDYVDTIVLLIAILAMEITITETNDSKDESICTMTISRRETIYVPYTETYKVRRWGIFYRKKSRTNYKIQYKTVWVIERTCCPGYNETNNVCVPTCNNSCVHGECIKPNTCKCEDGYSSSRNSELQGHVCEPVCKDNCKNGVCKLPNECMCNSGYQLTEEKLYCLPICDTNCEQHNARCVGPNNCTCDPGYRPADPNKGDTNDTLCAPICEVPCVNSKCTEPNVCSCNDGYEVDVDAFTCKPKCERVCLYGKCTAPNTCTCDPGYRLNETNECEPICSEPCVMGTCIAPEVCSCNEGYGLLGDAKYFCEPICEKACVHGTCTGPENCTCHDGYKLSGDDTMKHVCEPVCEKPCANGVCIAPGVCNCTEGYRFNGTEEERICVPRCKIPCEPGGICEAPDTCSCFEGYRSIDTSPKENEIASNVTEERTTACEPVCNPSCENGNCTDPDVCTCDEGYVRHAEGQCKPFCSSCYNGTCVAPNVCQCLEGFILTNESRCMPFCENSCENGDCVAPNECVCHTSFKMNENNSSCIKPCRRVCKGHGVCFEDEKPCECSYGWTGWDCDQPTVCVLLMDSNDKNLNGLTIYNETNSTLLDARRYAPYCYQCNETVDNRSFCFTITSDDGSSMVGCFVETESPCYLLYHNSTDAVSRMAGTLAAVTILIMAAVTAAAYFVIRRHQKKKMRKAITQSTILQGSLVNESPISEEETQSSTLNLYKG